MRLVGLCALACALAVTVGAESADAGNKPVAKPVPSLTPAATEKLWKKLADRGRFRLYETADCRPVRAVFYAGTDWLRLATKLAEQASPCGQYYVSVPPLVGDKSQPRADQAWRIRALGPNFHALAELNVTGWTNWVSTTGATWYDAGLEARRRMAASGYDVGAGDGWVVNEFSTAVRIGSGNARANMRAFLRGLAHDGVRGGVFITGMGQQTGELSVYQSRLQDWYEDTAFWQDMSAYVSDWSQELYGDVRSYAVPGTPLDARRDSLNHYLQHQVALARVAPEAATAARAFLDAAYNPLGNAAWQYDAAFGWTNVPVDLMQHYVSAQTYALRHAGSSRFGFAWSPKNLGAVTDFPAQSATLLERLAASIRDSAATPDAACGETWCGGDLEGSWLNDGWQSFAAWKPSQLAIVGEPQSLTAGTVSAALPVELRTNTGLAYTAGVPLAVSLSTTSATGRFATTAAGPWTSTLQLTIPNGASSAPFHYQDTAAGTATITAAAAGRQAAMLPVTIAAGPVARVTVSPSAVSLATGAVQSFTATAADAHGNALTPSDLAWSTTAPGTLSTTSGPTTVFTAGPAGGAGTVTATSGGVSSSASVSVVAPATARVASVVYTTVKRDVRVTLKLVDGFGKGISGATVGVRIDRNGSRYGSTSANTASDGTVSYLLSRPNSGCYTTTVTSVSAPGWDGATPANRFCK